MVKSKIVAGILSFFIPGSGLLYIDTSKYGILIKFSPHNVKSYY